MDFSLPDLNFNSVGIDHGAIPPSIENKSGGIAQSEEDVESLVKDGHEWIYRHQFGG